MRGFTPSLLAVAVAFVPPASSQQPSGAATSRAAPAQTQAGGAVVFRSGVDVVRLDVIVLGRDREPVTGLSASDFEVFEDGRAQEITSFEPVIVERAPRPPIDEPARVTVNRTPAPREGRCLYLFVDDTHLTSTSSQYLNVALDRFLGAELREGDWVTVKAPDAGVWWTARNAWEYRQLRTVVGAIRGQFVRDPSRDGLSDWQAICYEEYRDGAMCMTDTPSGAAAARVRANTFKPHGDTGSIIGSDSTSLSMIAAATAAVARRRVAVTLSGLREAIESLVPLRGHKSVVLFSEGFVLLPKMAGYPELVDAARRANVAIHFVDPRGLETPYHADLQDAPGASFGTLRELDAAGAGDLADATGGRTFASNDPAAGLRQVAAESDAYYLLGFVPGSSRGSGERKLRVRVKGEGLSVRARSRYFVERPAPEPAASADAAGGDSAQRKLAGLSPAAVAALKALPDATELPLRASTLFFEPNAAGEVTTLLALELPGVASGRLTLAAEARRAEGGKPVRDSFEQAVEADGVRAAVVARQWRLQPGAWQVRVLVEEQKTRRLGTVVHTFEVPRPGGLRLSTPVVTDVMEPGEKGAGRPRLRLDRRFGSGQVLYCQYAVYDPAPAPSGAPEVFSHWELRRGEELVRTSPTTRIAPTSDNRVARTIGVSLEGLQAGDYTLAVVVEDRAGKSSTSRTEEFSIGG